MKIKKYRTHTQEGELVFTISVSDWSLRKTNDLLFDIQTEIEPVCNAICHEIYNWVYDHQDNKNKKLLDDTNFQRTSYYFDNDTNAHTLSSEQESEYEIEIDYEEDI